MVVKKKRTAKQIAATKKLVALNKKRRGKTTAKKKKTVKKKKAVSRVSQVTKKKPSARLKRRRSANVKKGYFPNPIFYVAFVRDDADKKFYYAGFDSHRKTLIFDDDIEKAMWYRKPTHGVSEVEHLIDKTFDARTAKRLKPVKTERYKPGK